MRERKMMKEKANERVRERKRGRENKLNVYERPNKCALIMLCNACKIYNGENAKEIL